MSAWWWLAALAAVSLTACAAAVRIGYALHKTRPTPPNRSTR